MSVTLDERYQRICKDQEEFYSQLENYAGSKTPLKVKPAWNSKNDPNNSQPETSTIHNSNESLSFELLELLFTPVGSFTLTSLSKSLKELQTLDDQIKLRELRKEEKRLVVAEALAVQKQTSNQSESQFPTQNISSANRPSFHRTLSVQLPLSARELSTTAPLSARSSSSTRSSNSSNAFSRSNNLINNSNSNSNSNRHRMMMTSSASVPNLRLPPSMTLLNDPNNNGSSKLSTDQAIRRALQRDLDVRKKRAQDAEKKRREQDAIIQSRLKKLEEERLKMLAKK